MSSVQYYFCSNGHYWEVPRIYRPGSIPNCPTKGCGKNMQRLVSGKPPAGSPISNVQHF